VDGSRFDTWTRRKFGLAAGGAAVAGLLGLAGIDDAEARRGRGRKKKKKQCRKLGEFCNESNRDQKCCNSSYLCAQVPDLGSGNFCCKQVGDFCDTSSDCCGRDACDFATGRCRTTR
jgi:hypothetical protein